MNKEKIAVGIIGLGVGRHHLKAYEGNPNTYVKYLCDFDRKVLSNFKNKKINLISKPDPIFLDDEVKIVSIASFDEFHFEQVIMAIKFNKNVMVEKPICLTKIQLNKIKNALLKNKVIISSNMVLRTNPRFNFLKHSIYSSINDIYYIDTDYLWGRPEKLEGWRRNTVGYSIILGASIHLIDLILYLLGRLPKYVYALGNKFDIGKKIIASESFVALDLIFENGLIVRVNAHGTSQHPHFHNIKIYSKDYTFISDINGFYKIFGKNKKKKIDRDYPFKSNRHLIIDSFVSKILKKEAKYFVSFKEIQSAMNIGFAAHESLKRKKIIKIKY